MIEIMLGIILAPAAIIAGVFTIALGVGLVKGICQFFDNSKKI